METLQGSKNKMKPLTIEQLKSLEVGDYIWYERLGTNTKGYIKKNTTSPDVFCMFIGHPVDYSDYGKTWLAWKNKEQAEAKSEIVELLCRVGDTVYIPWFGMEKATWQRVPSTVLLRKMTVKIFGYV